eukprot:Hpha_TRINITY_DN15252_c2_g8::TRINITY_DN15252_c2_g8_i1::g.68132::m.68132/K15262/BCP1, BCCIP; protein BCP1
MPAKMRSKRKRGGDDAEEEPVAVVPPPEPAAEEVEDEMMIDGEEEEEEIEEGEEMQEVFFDVDRMEARDADSLFHLLQRWLPGEWPVDLDDFCKALQTSAFTSVVKIPDPNAIDDQGRSRGKEEEEAPEIFGCIGVVDIGRNQKLAGVKALLDALRRPAATDEVAKKDLGEWLAPAALERAPVGLIVAHRLTNLPAELGAQLHVNMYDELAAEKALGHFEYFLVLARVLLDAGETEDAEESKRAQKRARRQAAAQAPKPVIGEDSCLFLRPEELFYFRHRHLECGVKRFPYTVAGTAGATFDKRVAVSQRDKEALVPLLLHRSALPRLLREVKSLDDYFGDPQ